MTRTLISSDKQEVVIGFDAPFCVIGERINPTGRKLLAAEMAEGNYDRVISDALAPVEAGATMLDVNAGIPMADEPAILAESIKLSRIRLMCRLPSTARLLLRWKPDFPSIKASRW